MYRLNIDTPKDMLRIAKEAHEQGKPYDICLACPFMRESCDGPNILAMEYPRWLEWANARAKDRRLTREKIAELANLAPGTVSTAMSGRTNDVRTETMRAITKVLVGGCWGQYPCHFAAMLINGEVEDIPQEDIPSLQRELAAERERRQVLETDSQKKIAYLRQDVAQRDHQIEFKDSRIRDLEGDVRRKDKALWTLVIFLIVLVVTVMGFLIYDTMNPDVGWLRPTAGMYNLPL